MNIGVHVSLSILVSSVCMPSSGIAMSYSSPISSFLRNLHTVLHSGCTKGFLFSVPFVKEIVFSPLYILASFVKDKVSIGAWIYLWAFYLVPLIYISVFVPVPYCLDDCSFGVDPEVKQVNSSRRILLSQDCFGYSSFSVFP